MCHVVCPHCPLHTQTHRNTHPLHHVSITQWKLTCIMCSRLSQKDKWTNSLSCLFLRFSCAFVFLLSLSIVSSFIKGAFWFCIFDSEFFEYIFLHLSYIMLSCLKIWNMQKAPCYAYTNKHILYVHTLTHNHVTTLWTSPPLSYTFISTLNSCSYLHNLVSMIQQSQNRNLTSI